MAMKAGTDTGSLMNHLYSRMNSAVPEVGMGCTMLSWTDRHAATVIRVLGPNAIEIQEDNAVRTDQNGMSDCQKYEYTPNPTGAVELVKFTVKGWLTTGKQHVMLGRRDSYYDFSF